MIINTAESKATLFAQILSHFLRRGDFDFEGLSPETRREGKIEDRRTMAKRCDRECCFTFGWVNKSLFFAGVLTFINAGAVFAAPAKTLPFIYRESFAPSSATTNLSGMELKSVEALGKSTKIEIPADDIAAVVESFRSSLCDKIKNGAFKVWIQADASGKIFGVGLASQSGIEITILCGTATPTTLNTIDSYP